MARSLDRRAPAPPVGARLPERPAYDRAIRPRTHIGRIVSGGQTGADRAALDWAIEHAIPYAGWCPRGGWAEDLVEPPGLLAAYPHLRATPGRDPAQRTARNVTDSDATLILTHGRDDAGSPGTALTIACAHELARPLAVVDVFGAGARSAIERFVRSLPPGAALNVAGPRESEAPGIYAAGRAALDALR